MWHLINLFNKILLASPNARLEVRLCCNSTLWLMTFILNNISAGLFLRSLQLSSENKFKLRLETLRISFYSAALTSFPSFTGYLAEQVMCTHFWSPTLEWIQYSPAFTFNNQMDLWHLITKIICGHTVINSSICHIEAVKVSFRYFHGSIFADLVPGEVGSRFGSAGAGQVHPATWWHRTWWTDPHCGVFGSIWRKCDYFYSLKISWHPINHHVLTGSNNKLWLPYMKHWESLFPLLTLHFVLHSQSSWKNRWCCIRRACQTEWWSSGF